MEPTIADGSIVWIFKQFEIRHGEVGVFMLEDRAVCKRFYNRGGVMKLTSDNPDYEDIEGDELVGLRCVGKVLGDCGPCKKGIASAKSDENVDASQELTEEQAIALVRQHFADIKGGTVSSTTSEKRHA